MLNQMSQIIKKCKAAEQNKKAAARTMVHNRIKISVKIVEY
jgi:hypothetical protein